MEHADGLGRLTGKPAGILLIILGAAGILRLFELGAGPLSPAEAAEAWAALGGEAAGASSALVLGINRALFWVFGAGDAVARLLPALIGIALPLVAWLLVPIIGRRGALVSAALLALSPSLVLFSRTVSGVMPGLAAALVWLVALWRYRDEGGGRWLVIGGIALGAGLAAGPAFITTALLILAASWAAHPAGFADLWRPLAAWRVWGIALAAALLGSTTLFAYPDGLGAVAGGLEAWIGGFGIGSWSRPLGLLAGYEPAALAFGLLGLIGAVRRGDRAQRTLVYWALGALLLGLFRADQPDAALAALLPLALLAGSFCDRVLGSVVAQPAERPGLLAGVAAILILGTHIAVSLGQFAYRDSSNAANANVHLLLVGIAVILIAGVVALIWTYSSRLAGQSLLLAWVVLLAFYGWGKSWELGHTHRNDPRQPWLAEGTTLGTLSLVEELRAASQRATGATHDLSLTVAVEGPVLRWYLRDFAQVAWVDALRPDDISQAVITPAEGEQPLLGDSYLGSDFPLREKPAEPSVQTVGGSLRWLLHRQAPFPRHTDWVVLWLRQDVVLLGN
jgi:hypothetical protein